MPVAPMRPVMSPRLDDSLPPFKPPPTLGFGSCCFRAVASVEQQIEHVPGWTVAATVTGYDTSPAIAKVVDEACRVQASTMPGARCSDSSLVMLKGGMHRCEGEVYVDVDGERFRAA